METSAQRDARSLIEKISREHTLGGDIIGTRFELLVSNCLEILSSQLYEKSTHFLLELVQNADDNTYTCANPTLSFSYRPGSLRIDCNEVGFTAENVEAICAISRSTKSGKTSYGEYIGEKGIGFKSVFKAADVVWISSREFTFKFDKTKFLGMVTPIWADFPEPTRPGYTSTYLQLSKDYEEDTLIHELLTFDNNLLIFLRRIEVINIRVSGRNEQVWEKTIRKTESRQGDDWVTILHVGESTFQYLTRTHIIKNLPKEHKRPNWPQTKLLLAFPTADFPEQPQLVPQNVYAFLPIRNYGLKFLLQGDFLLTASREDIESTLPWNRTLRDAVAEAFLLSIHHFNQGDLKYVWPYYLPSTSMAASSFLEPAVTSILTELRESSVLESCAGTMVKPSSLKYVPLDPFADGEGKPFTLDPQTAASYLSLEYPIWAIEATGVIGVSQLSPQEFLQDLSLAVIQDPTTFRTRSATWHSQLAETLVRLGTDAELLSMIQDIYLIPLHDGTWTSARGHEIFFSKSETSMEIPSGIEVFIIDSTAESDPNRCRLFTSLGVKAWDAPEICRLVLKIHASSDFNSKSLTRDQLISHAMFLYKASWQPPKTADLWFATMQDERCLGRKLYIPGSIAVNSPAGRIFTQLQKKFAVIHNDYLEVSPLDADWPLWLVSNLGLSMVPRLITPHIDPEPQPIQTFEVPENKYVDVPATGNHALQDYQMQLMLLEQMNKKRLMAARTEQDVLAAGNHALQVPHAQMAQQGTEPETTQARYPSPELMAQNALQRQAARQGSVSDPQRDDVSEKGRDSTQAKGDARIFATEKTQAENTKFPAQDNGISSPSSSSSLSPIDRSLLSPIDSSQARNSTWQRDQKNKRDGERPFETAPKAKLKEAATSTTTSRELPVKDTQPEQVSSGERMFALSEEFAFMFRECHTSDVLQLLRDNWHHYSKWIDGAHMKWQNADFLESSTQLKNTLSASRVQSAKGSLPLQETVLPMIDPELDEGRLIPALDIKDPQHPEWTLLSYFGVVMKEDIHYYLRCLIAVSEEQVPDIDKVAYIYEQIQTRHKGNEDLISAAFYERDIIFVHSKSRKTTKPLGWINMKECISRDIVIESDYPSSSYLFRCLLSPGGDPIAPIVAAATLITSSSKLEDISRHFRDVSNALKDVNTSKAAQLLRPLRNGSVFPITNGGKHSYNDLLGVHNTSWFIADRPLIRESFHGKMPLLALPIEDLPALEDLFRVLRLDNRILSKLTTSRTHPKGRVTTHWAYTASLRAKSPFIKALIPHSHHDRATVARQVDEMRVSVATHISQTFLLKLAGTEIYGSPVRGQVSLSSAGGCLNLFMTEDCAAAECPPYELVRIVADACNIKDPNHYSLLYTALSNSSMESIAATFTQQGINVKGLIFDKSKKRYLAQRRDLLRIPSPFWGELNRMKATLHGMIEATKVDRFQRVGGIHSRGRDRRLPMIRVIGEGGLVCEDDQPGRLMYQPDSIDGWDHVQYLGEHMVSKLLQKYLGHVYDPERDWTSFFRSRSGYKPFESPAASAAFILRELNVRDQMTAFIMKYGQSQTPNWKVNLQANPPVYHLELAVSTGSKASSFVINSSQIERMRQFRMQGMVNHPHIDIAVLVRVSDIHSDNLLSISLFVDPWRLFDSNEITFEGNWIFKGALQENGSGSTRKRRKLYTPSISWAVPATPGRHPPSLTTRLGHRDRETYTHRALDSGHIRLLYLLPGDQGDELQGVIFHIPYESSGTYRTLSYVWGTDQRTQELTTPDGILRITSSLHKGLRCLRHKNKAILLWVDAICINQEDNAEKAQQIRLIPKIFQMASSTCAFLEGGEGSDAAIEMLMQVRYKDACEAKSTHETGTSDRTELEHGTELEEGTDSGQSTETEDEAGSNDGLGSEDWPKDLPTIPASWNDRCIPPLNDDIWTSVRAVFDLPWFRRVWIIQEVVAAPIVKIVCGKWIIDWDDLHLATEIIDREVQLSDDDFSQLKKSWEPFLSLAAQREWEARQYRWTLIMLLENFRYAESTRSRDHFFALLGLASDGNETTFEPDYDSPLKDIVLRFARTFVRQGRGMQLLYRAGLNQQSSRFPSWIPDWTVKIPSGLHDSSEGGISYSASGSQRVKIKCAPDTNELNVEGFVVDIIKTISKSSNLEQEWENYFKEIDAMVNSLAPSPLRDSRENLKWKVPIADVLYPKVAVSGGLDLRSSYRAFRRYVNKGKQKGKAVEENSCNGENKPHFTTLTGLDANVGPDSLQKESMSYIAALQDTLSGWRFVTTKKGYVGVVPNMAQVSDTVAIFKGGRVPFILQKSMERPQAFRLVGECYIHGIMNGEGLSLPGVVESEFRLH